MRIEPRLLVIWPQGNKSKNDPLMFIKLSCSLRSKYIAEISEQFQASLFVYDEGILGNDIQLANALWRRFFLSMREVEEGSGEDHMPDPEKLELLVRYVRRTASYLDSKDAADIIVRQQISWPKVLDV